MTKIEIDLRDLGLPTGEDEHGPTGSSTLQDLIINAAAEKLLGGVDYQIRSDIQEKFRTEYNRKIQERVAELVQEAFDAPIQRTTRWGETQGEATTVKEIIRETIEKFMNAKPTNNGNRYRDDPYRNLSEAIDASVQNIMTTEMKKTVEAARGAIHEKVTDAALKAAVAALSK
ncbi:hypothetical protein SEA_PUREGLOBE5_91 [Arthrobacter phage Pureglobe5]|nr:hypothetical protein SEA_ODYSSEY395_91 [Arthrobacter phage Odyssey395]UYL87454.1 hypothetical protein SEA_PUREGLOBE5_91 [Arthrobacter phage Pureglobe5]